jgi:ATP-dependent Lon protease
VGGDLLSIEALRLPGKGRMKTTGKLGDVMKESIDAASSYVRSIAPKIGVKPPRFDTMGHPRPRARGRDAQGRAVGRYRHGDVHRVGADPDSGAQGHRHDRRGDAARQCLPIGGLKEKLLAALRGGIKTVLIPEDNEKDLPEIPDNVKEGLTIIPVSRVARF